MSGLFFSFCCIVVKEHQTAGRLPQEGCQLQSSLRLRLNGRTAHFQNEKIIPGHTSMSRLLFFHFADALLLSYIITLAGENVNIGSPGGRRPA